jgi:Ca2+/H+ antiporter, TMEM165/GDT1 family
MRIRRPSRLLVLFLASLALADLESAKTGRLQKRDFVAADADVTQDDILKLNAVPGAPVGRSKVTQQAALADAAPTAKATATTTKGYVGTEDAPVDGLDGKPHAGPFVDTTPEEPKSKKAGAAGTTSSAKALPTSLEKLKQGATGEDGWRLEDIPEKNDGVMNDEGRVAPKKGTTGTEGGITEKSKEKLAKGSSAENKPQEPKEAPPLPHSEQERIEEEQNKKEAGGKQTTSKSESKATDKDAKDGEAKKKGDVLGMEKPTGLPEKPHNIPHPDPKGPGGKNKEGDGPPVDSSKSSWLQDTMPYTEGKTNPKKASAAGSTTTAAGGEEMEWHEWFHSFVLSLTMILFSEIGDKTFLVAALMAMRHPRLIVFSAALSALIAMTVLSAVLGHAVPTLLPKRFTTFAAAMLFLVFGVRLLREGLAMPKEAGVAEEMKEVEAELEEKEHDIARRASRSRGSSVSAYVLESGRGRSASAKLPTIEPSPPSSRSPSPASKRDRLAGLTNLLSLVLSPAWVQTFIMTFLGEWGDRSQIATIAMAAGQDYWWVTLGAITGHACCTGLAVIGGRALAGRVSMRVGEYFPNFLFNAKWGSVMLIICSDHRRRRRLPGLRLDLHLRMLCRGIMMSGLSNHLKQEEKKSHIAFLLSQPKRNSTLLLPHNPSNPFLPSRTLSCYRAKYLH